MLTGRLETRVAQQTSFAYSHSHCIGVLASSVKVLAYGVTPSQPIIVA